MQLRKEVDFSSWGYGHDPSKRAHICIHTLEYGDGRQKPFPDSLECPGLYRGVICLVEHEELLTFDEYMAMQQSALTDMRQHIPR